MISPTIIFYHISLAPLEKLISSDRLTFIPNLYYQQYRLLDVLNENRLDYPQQKILVPRQQSSHDVLLFEMRKNHFILEEEIKYRKVICFHLAKCAKEQFFKKRLKLQEKQLFHRIAFSQLAESVKRKFEENKAEDRINEQKDQVKEHSRIIKSRISDDIFMDRQDQNSVNQQSDILNGIFEDRIPEVEQKEQIPKTSTIEDYMKIVNQECDASKQCKKILNRKLCLKKINQNIRKRIKSKINQQTGQKSLNSATVLITSLISSQPEVKQGQGNQNLFIDPPAQTQFLSNVQGKNKKKKQENFQLKWNKDLLDQFQQKNSKFDINKSKYQSNYLTANLVRDEKEYEKIFHKNIIGKDPFPPTLNSIPEIDSIFKTNHYYNTSADREYQNFIIKHNKKAKFQKFRQIANYALADSYYMESQPSNIAKLFLTQQGSFSDRVIYKVNNNKIVPINAVQQKVNLTRDQILLLSFLVKRYLCIFGSNWKLITTLILTHPNFSSMYLNTQQIQQLYQIPKQNENLSSIEQVTMMNKKVLPSSIFINNSYEQMEPQRKMETIYEQMTDQNDQIRLEETNNIDLNSYQDLINQPLREHQYLQEYVFHNTAKMYQQYLNNTKLPSLHEPSYSLTQSLSSVITQFEGKSQIRHVEGKQPTKFNQCSDWVLQKVKNQIKFTTPTRKRKNITDKSSQLVKILHTLKQKLQIPPKQTLPQARVPSTTAQNPTQLAKPVATTPNPTVTPAPVPAVTQPVAPVKKTLLKQKPEDKKQKPKQPRKKKQGKDQKQPEKDPQSK